MNLILQFKLNHGLIVSEHNRIKQSIETVVVEDGKLHSLKEQPSVYTHINSRDDFCVNVPFYELTYKDDYEK